MSAQTTYYESQLIAKLGYTKRHFEKLMREAEEAHVPYEEIVRTEAQSKLKRRPYARQKASV